MRFIAAALLLVSVAFAQQPKFQPFVAGGIIYNVRETDIGGWAEMGVVAKQKYSASLGWSDMFTDEYRFRELETMGRYWIIPHFAIEAGYGFGFGCYLPKPTSCGRWASRWYAPLVGVAYQQPLTKNHKVSALVRMDITKTQLSARPAWLSRAKDDGLRFRMGVMFTPKGSN